jgi:hypothetical protein
MKDSILLITSLNGVGLSQDAEILRELLSEQGYQVQVQDFKTAPAGHFGLNIFLEVINRSFMPHADANVLIPNPEWFMAAWRQDASRMDAVWVKSKAALDPFGRINQNIKLLGYTSRDMKVEKMHPGRAFFHLAGKSTAKGTYTLLEAWARHPEWPQLTVVSHPDMANNWTRSMPNYNLISRRLPADELKNLMNMHLFHICPSEIEGFGHYIVEGMSTEAVVITTDGSPMNEHVRPDRGILLKPVNQFVNRCGFGFKTPYGEIENAVNLALGLSDDKCEELGKKARDWYIQNDQRFRTEVVSLVRSVLVGVGA